jgi:cytochrome c553
MAHARDPASRRTSVIALAAVGGLLAFSVGVAFVALPLAQAPNAGLTPWTAICRAVGLLPGTPAQRQPPSVGKAAPVSRVSWTPRILAILADADARPGAQLAAAVCANCHGEQGLTLNTDFPRLAGQSAPAIYKQLSDFRSGARYSQVMSPVAQQLTPDQLAEVAAYFASTGDEGAMGRRYFLPDPPIKRLAQRGDPKRNLPPCDSCHGPHSGGPIEAPVIAGQLSEYLERQLNAYAGGQRSNDVYRRMRDIAAKLTPDERHRLGRYYQGTQ